MKSFLGLWAIVAVVCVSYLVFWPVPVDPKPWSAPIDSGYSGVFERNERLKQLSFLEIAGRSGPEDVAIGPDGTLYIAVHDGEILRRPQVGGRAEVFATTNGRPLGVEFGPDGTLFVADAYLGLLAIDPQGTVTLLADSADGVPIRYANDLDIAADGTIFFTDASTRFGAKAHGGTLPASILDLIEHSNSGRVLKYDPQTGKATLFANGLTFPNGISIGEDGGIYVAETGTYSVWRYEPDGTGRQVLRNLPGFPDNLNAGPDGSFWLGLVSPRNPIVDYLSGQPQLRQAILRLPETMKPAPKRYGFVLRIDAEGRVLETLQDPAGTYALTTGAITATDGSLFVSSLTEPRLGVLYPD